MILVADTNIIFSILLKKDSKEWEVMLRDDIEIFIPKFLVIEIFKHEKKFERIDKNCYKITFLDRKRQRQDLGGAKVKR